ncbi:MAG TPA: hypothetical protein VGE74_27055, partial [Gemmata sp.]
MLTLRERLQEAAARVLADGPVPLCQLAKLVPEDRPGRRGHVSAGALVRWITKGRSGVRLDGARLSGKGWCSSVAALARFSAELAAKELGEEPEVSAPCERERRAKAACAELDR